KNPAAKNPAAKPAAKPAVKPAAKKPAAKPAIKKPETKAAAPKTTAAKTSAPKTAEKKPAAKTAAKPSPAKAASPKKTASAAVSNKLAAKKSAKPSVLQAPVDNLDPNVKYRDLFEAFTQGKLPLSQGYIVSSFFDERSAYSIYEVVSYAGVKEIYPSGDGITFVTGGRKLHILVEPATYHFKPVEPVSRAEGERIPKRFSELETIIAKNQSRIMVAKEPIETYGSFTVLRPQGINFAIIFYELPDIIQSLTAFFENSLNQQRKIPHGDAKKAAQYITSVVKSHMGFEGLYS
ncbi:MAG: hypothetical protein FWC21_03160, partial [Treponema sp.]|nr:hypothetical protein [Treponema sp.]